MLTPTVLDLCEDVVPCISSRDITAGGQRQQSNAENANLSWAGLCWAGLGCGDGAAFQTGPSVDTR